jgi:hypothetical protein
LQSGKNIIVLFAILNLPFGPILARRAATNARGGKILSFIDRSLGRYSPGALKLAITFVENLFIVNQISKQLLKEKMAEARELKKAGSYSVDGSGSKVDVLSLLQDELGNATAPNADIPGRWT